MRATISRAEVCAFIRTLGADPDQVTDVEFDPPEIRVTTFHLDEQGRRHLVNPPGLRKEGDPPDEVATETTVIRIVGDPNAETVRMRHPNLDAEVDVPASAVGQHAVAGWEVVPGTADAISELTGTPYAWTGGEQSTEQGDQEQPGRSAPDETKSAPRGRRRTSKESE